MTNNTVFAFLALVVCAIAVPLPVVNMGSVKGFAILSAQGVTNIPTSQVTGDIGLSPGTGSGITGFAPSEVNGSIYCVDAAYPLVNTAIVAPVKLTAAKGDLTIAYNDAAGRTPVPSGPTLNRGAGELGGQTVAAGLYKFTTTANLLTGDVTLNGAADDVWIFQIGTSLNIGTGKKVILTGGAKAENVFWQVGTLCAIASGASMQGTIIASTGVTFGAGSSLVGSATSLGGAITLSSTTIVYAGHPATGNIVTPEATTPTTTETDDSSTVAIVVICAGLLVVGVAVGAGFLLSRRPTNKTSTLGAKTAPALEASASAEAEAEEEDEGVIVSDNSSS